MDPPPPEAPCEPTNKGKGRAEDPTERTPLLAEQSSSNILARHDYETALSQRQSNRRLRSRLTMVFLGSLSLTIAVFVLVALLAWSYATRVSTISPNDVVETALVLQGPDRVDVTKITYSGEIWLTVDARLGMDAGIVIGVNNEPKDTLASSVWKALGRWGIQTLDRVTVNLSTITIASRSNSSTVLATIVASPVLVPLKSNPPNDSSWLTPVSISVAIRPNTDISTWLHFIRDSWDQGIIDVQANVGQAIIQGGYEDERSWRKWLSQQMVDIRTPIRFRIPPIPGLPAPGHEVPLPSVEDLVTLQSFHISSSVNQLDIRAFATAIDPAPPTFKLTSPSIPFIISLPRINSSYPPMPIASVSTAPFALTHPNITLDISGIVLPLENESTPIISSFLSRYLTKEPNTIFISSPLLKNLTVQTIFPSPNPPPRLLRDVTIKDMKVKPGTTFLASGTVFARIVLPKGIDVDLDVSRVFPDVLVFDGDVPEDVELISSPPQVPLPNPLPDKAFGHIRPDDWLKALSKREVSQEDGDGATYAVSARIVDVPLQVLPGRQKEFSNFVSKVLFGTDGAVAGLLGSTAVAARVRGLPLPGQDGEMELSGLPFRGSVRVGKKGMLQHEDITI
ncbi:hypothetical protein H0H92_006952 [Tricholoma furcatifolium]|nr:hypothetical protein H0H92_006952 [Tricholoma furcatifolium]